MIEVKAYCAKDGTLFKTAQEANEYELIGELEKRIEAFEQKHTFPANMTRAMLIRMWEKHKIGLTTSTLISRKHFKTRVYLTLRRAKIATISDLLEYSVIDLMKIPDLGKVALQDIKEFVANNGYVLATTPKNTKE